MRARGNQLHCQTFCPVCRQEWPGMAADAELQRLLSAAGVSVAAPPPRREGEQSAFTFEPVEGAPARPRTVLPRCCQRRFVLPGPWRCTNCSFHSAENNVCRQCHSSSFVFVEGPLLHDFRMQWEPRPRMVRDASCQQRVLQGWNGEQTVVQVPCQERWEPFWTCQVCHQEVAADDARLQPTGPPSQRCPSDHHVLWLASFY